MSWTDEFIFSEMLKCCWTEIITSWDSHDGGETPPSVDCTLQKGPPPAAPGPLSTRSAQLCILSPNGCTSAPGLRAVGTVRTAGGCGSVLMVGRC